MPTSRNPYGLSGYACPAQRGAGVRDLTSRCVLGAVCILYVVCRHVSFRPTARSSGYFQDRTFAMPATRSILLSPSLERAIVCYGLSLDEECDRAKLVFFRQNGTPIVVLDLEVVSSACEIPDPLGVS